MRIAKIALIVIITAALINFVRQGDTFPLPRVLPCCDGLPLSPIHFLAGAVLIFLMPWWGLRRLNRSTDETNADDTEPYDNQYEEDSEDDENEEA